MLVAIIASVPGCLAAIIGLRANSNAKRARFQVENDHETNMRVENDERHHELKSWLRRLDRSVGGVRDDYRLLAERVHTLEELEMTQPRSRKKE